MKRFWFSVWVLGSALFCSAENNYDLILRHGRIIDGSGKPAFNGDVAVKDGRIAAIGNVSGNAKNEFDVHGLVIAPGFIDVHTHAEDIDDMPRGENFLRMGVTTLVLGNCGGSVLNVGDFFKKLDQEKISPNIATLYGHGTVRAYAMGGSFNRPPTSKELGQMKQMTEQAMKDGAVGISTGLIYTPGVFAKTDEIIELAKVVSAYDGIYTSHQRSESDKIFDSLNEIFKIAREAKVRAEVSHIKLSGPANWHQAEKVLHTIEKARAEGLQITQDEYVYTASSTTMSQLIPDEYKDGGRSKIIARLNDPATKKKMVAEMKRVLKKRKNDDYSYAIIAAYHDDPSLNGLSIAEAAEKVRHSKSLDDQIEMVFDIERHGGATGVFHGMSEEDLTKFLQHTNTMVACDSGVRKFGSGVPHPRGYGDNARVFARYVREQKVITLEDAVRKMTSLPAKTFEFNDRGSIEDGKWADLVVFDPDKIQDNATYKDPHHYSTGFKYVIVNGVVVVEDDKHNGAKPGMTLRHTSTQTANAK